MIWEILLWSIYGGSFTALMATAYIVTQYPGFKATAEKTENETEEEGVRRKKIFTVSLTIALCIHFAAAIIPIANTVYLGFILVMINSGKAQEPIFSAFFKMKRAQFLEYIARFNPKARALRRTFDENLHIDE